MLVSLPAQTTNSQSRLRLVVILGRAAVRLDVIRRDLPQEHCRVPRVLRRLLIVPLLRRALRAACRHRLAFSLRKGRQSRRRLCLHMLQQGLPLPAPLLGASPEQPGVMQYGDGSQSAHCELAAGGTLSAQPSQRSRSTKKRPDSGGTDAEADAHSTAATPPTSSPQPSSQCLAASLPPTRRPGSRPSGPRRSTHGRRLSSD